VEALRAPIAGQRAGAGAAGADGIDRAEGGADRVDVGAGSSARTRAGSSSIRAASESAASQETITPTLTNSPRSTRGTTRTTA
jgi:hypothetical protein